jgi:hypothetical protein
MAWLHAVIDVPEATVTRAAEFWAAVLGWPLGPPWPGHPELRSFAPPDGDAYVHLQVVEGPARIHVDLEAEDRGDLVCRATALGADPVDDRDRWTTLSSPGELPFCVVDAVAHRPPGPVAWPLGHRSRLVQVCIDSPRSAQPRETDFWRALLGGRWVDSPAREFVGKWHDDAGSPVQLLFQVLDEEDGPVRAHLDHGTDDLPAEVRRILDLGADDIGPGRGWHALRDPAGLPFCVTGNSPELTRRRDLG